MDCNIVFTDTSFKWCLSRLFTGFIDTDMTHQLSPEQITAIKANITLGRLGQPEDVAHMASFLVHAHYVTGQVRLHGDLSPMYFPLSFHG